jgi:hypothetical protein
MVIDDKLPTQATKNLHGKEKEALCTPADSRLDPFQPGD